MNRLVLTRILLMAAVAAGGDVVLGAQATLPKLFTNAECQSGFQTQWNAYHDGMQRGDNQAAETAKRLLKDYLNPNEQIGCTSDLFISEFSEIATKEIAKAAVARVVSAAEKQAGSSVSSSGSTNVVSKNFASELFSVANEYGALTSSTSGQTTTLSGSLDELFNPFAGGLSGLVAECAVEIVKPHFCVSSPLLNALSRVDYSASLDLSQPSTITGTATGQASGGTQQVTGTQGGSNFSLSQFTAKVLLWGGKPSTSDLQSAANGQGLSSDTLNRMTQLRRSVNSLSQFSKWQDDSANMLLDASVAQIQGVMRQRINLLVKLIAPGNDPTAIIEAALGYAESIAKDAVKERQIWEKAIWAKPIVSFEYDYNTPANQPTNSTFRLVYGQSLNKSKSLKITANGAASMYNSQPSSSIPGASRLRDTQFGAEGDYTLPALGQLNSSLLSLAYYFQDQTSPAILNVTPSSPLTGISFTGLSSSATQVFTQTGHIHLGQVKLTLGSSSSGFSLPISVTASNRSELIVNNKISVRPQIGVSYSFDSLLSK
jgi:hypothetical protein